MSYPYGGINAVAFGTAAGTTLQGQNTVAVGYYSGVSNQGASAVAIGSYAGQINQPASSIVINATGSTLSGVEQKGFYVAPLRNIPASTFMLYDPVSKEVVYSNTISAPINTTNLSASTITVSSLTANSIVTYSSISASTINEHRILFYIDWVFNCRKCNYSEFYSVRFYY